MTMNLQEKIAKANTDHEAAEPTPVEVELGGEKTTVAIKPIWGAQWADLVTTHPPRPGATYDEAVGYNTDAVIADYPVDAITVDGEPVDEETWQAVSAVLNSPHRRSVASVMYGLNHLEPLMRLRAAEEAAGIGG